MEAHAAPRVGYAGKVLFCRCVSCGEEWSVEQAGVVDSALGSFRAIYICLMSDS